jgi:tetratricopeptide (TPR) repeat protein
MVLAVFNRQEQHMKTFRWSRAGAVLVAMSLTVAVAQAEAPETSPLDANPDFKAARQSIAAGRHADAVPFLAAVLREHPADPDALSLMGFSLRKSGKRQDALTYYMKALSIEPRHLGANEYLGELYVEVGDIERAKERLAVLEGACGKDCEQARDVAEAIEAAQKKQ